MPSQFTNDELSVIAEALRVLADRIADRPIDEFDSRTSESHRDAYLAKQSRVRRVADIIPKVRAMRSPEAAPEPRPS